jgi:hypothetical protein
MMQQQPDASSSLYIHNDFSQINKSTRKTRLFHRCYRKRCCCTTPTTFTRLLIGSGLRKNPCHRVLVQIDTIGIESRKLEASAGASGVIRLTPLNNGARLRDGPKVIMHREGPGNGELEGDG